MKRRAAWAAIAAVPATLVAAAVVGACSSAPVESLGGAAGERVGRDEAAWITIGGGFGDDPGDAPSQCPSPPPLRPPVTRADGAVYSCADLVVGYTMQLPTGVACPTFTLADGATWGPGAADPGIEEPKMTGNVCMYPFSTITRVVQTASGPTKVTTQSRPSFGALCAAAPIAIGYLIPVDPSHAPAPPPAPTPPHPLPPIGLASPTGGRSPAATVTPHVATGTPLPGISPAPNGGLHGVDVSTVYEALCGPIDTRGGSIGCDACIQW